MFSILSHHCSIRQGKLDDLGEHFEEQEEGGEEEARPRAEDERGGRVQPGASQRQGGQGGEGQDVHQLEPRSQHGDQQQGPVGVGGARGQWARLLLRGAPRLDR